jgi:heme/copper-type cytochrome/quinol oxidase subunit 2
MRGKVVVEEESAYKAWLGKQPTFAKSLAEAGTGGRDGLKLVSSGGEAVTAGGESAR